MRLVGMLRAVLVLALVGCASVGHEHAVGTSRLAFRASDTGPARFVRFVNLAKRITHSDVNVSFAMVLPGGDWLASLQGQLVRFSGDGRKVRWATSAVDVWNAAAVGEHAVVAVGTIADASALNGSRRAMFRIDTTTGALDWQVESPPITSGARAVLVRAGTTTIAAGAYGATAVDDAGAITWTEKHDPTEEPVLVGAGDHVVLARSPLRVSGAVVAGPPLRQPLRVRVLDAATGIERGSTEVLPDGDYFTAGQAGLAADGRIAIEAWDMRDHTKPDVYEGKPVTVHSSSPTPRVIVVDLHNPAHPTATSRTLTTAEVDAPPRNLPKGAVVFVDQYAASNQGPTMEVLSLRVVDLAAGRIERSPLLRPRKLDLGDGVSSFVQVIQLARHGTRIDFAGVFAGHVGVLRSRIAVVDTCEAQDFIECSEGEGETTLAPFAGFVGTIGD